MHATHTVLVHIRVKPEHVDAFIAATGPNHYGATRETGNLRFDLLQSPADPTRFILYEAYASAEAAVAHKLTPHYRQWRDAVAEMMAEPRESEPLHLIYPHQLANKPHN